MLDELDKKIIATVQDEIPIVPRPYLALAEKIGITEAELITRLNNYAKSGKLRKSGAVLRHREVGFAANVLCAWKVPPDKLEQIGANMATNTAVSHCYDRKTTKNWPYNVYTMIHAHTRAECSDIANNIAQENNLTDYKMLFSIKEWKKNKYEIFLLSISSLIMINI